MSQIPDLTGLSRNKALLTFSRWLRRQRFEGELGKLGEHTKLALKGVVLNWNNTARESAQSFASECLGKFIEAYNRANSNNTTAG